LQRLKLVRASNIFSQFELELMKSYEIDWGKNFKNCNVPFKLLQIKSLFFVYLCIQFCICFILINMSCESTLECVHSIFVYLLETKLCSSITFILIDHTILVWKYVKHLFMSCESIDLKFYYFENSYFLAVTFVVLVCLLVFHTIKNESCNVHFHNNYVIKCWMGGK